MFEATTYNKWNEYNCLLVEEKRNFSMTNESAEDLNMQSFAQPEATLSNWLCHEFTISKGDI